LFLAAAAAFGSVAVSAQLPPWALGGFGLAWVGGLVWREHTTPLRARAVNGATAGLLLALILQVALRAVTLPLAAGEGALLLCANRLLIRRTARDDALLHLTCWLLLASGAVLTGELWYGLCLVAYALLAAPSMTLSELRRGIEEEAPEQAHALLASSELVSPRLWSFASALGLLSVAFGLVIFPVFPRFQSGLLDRFSGGAPRMGISDRVDLTGKGNLSGSPQVVLQATLDGDPWSARYWRAVTLDHFTGSGWNASAPALKRWHGFGHPQAAAVRGELSYFPSGEGWIPIPEGLTKLRRGDDRLSDLWSAPSGDLRVRAPYPLRVVLEFAASPLQRPPASASDRASALQLPSLDPEVRAIAEEILTPDLSVEEAVQQVERYFATFSYSTEITQGEGSPLTHFLAVRRGHCQLFATAAAVLLRSAGFPARYVVGYYSSLPADGHDVILREWDAHAWAEVEVPGKGWMRVDATPPDHRGVTGRTITFWEQVLDLWGLAQFRWLRSVVDYDARSQVESFQWLGDLFRPGLLKPLLLFVAAAAFALLLLLLFRNRGRSVDLALRLERRCFVALAELAGERGPSETIEEALARIRRAGPRAAQATALAEPILARLSAARFGDRPLDSSDVDRISQGISALRSRFQDVT
jgi:protein-glutamine gamma-glutamyltransferase